MKNEINNLIQNGYAETHVGYHAEYRMWHGIWKRGCYAHIADTHNGTMRIYANSYEELYAQVLQAKAVETDKG